jgi:curved DNA-binding protein CbpA
MKTLYEVLNVDPDDDAASIGIAFRKAARASHPDLNTDDPDAPVRFAQIVRASAILRDPELRAIYDRMLEFEHRRLRRGAKLVAVFGATRSFAVDLAVVFVLALLLAGGYALLTRFSEIHDDVAARNLPRAAAARPSSPAGDAADVAATAPAAPGLAKTVAAIPPPSDARDRKAAETAGLAETAVAPTPPQPDTTSANAPHANPENVEIVAPSAGPTANGPSANGPTANGPTVKRDTADTSFDHELAPDSPSKDSAFHHDRGIARYRSGDFALALADFDLALQLDPNSANAYIDRSIVLYRMGELKRAFADVAQAVRIKNSRRSATTP